jgi:transketolase
MRTVLSRVIAEKAKTDPSFLLLSGDHGYALFDELRNKAPEKFINVGIMEQALIGMAAGLAKVGHRPMCYGLASFVPIRVLEQIKFDICLGKLPVKLIGDGAGLVYTHLGNSHLCAEDVSALSSLPDIEIFSPGDREEMEVCFEEYVSSDNPAYLRVGKCDNPNINELPLATTAPYLTHSTQSKTAFVSTGAMLGSAHQFAKDFAVDHISIMRIKPLHREIVDMLKVYDRLIFFEEHVKRGGMMTAVIELLIESNSKIPQIDSFHLDSSFIHKAGKYQFAMSQHGISIEQMRAKLKELL